MTDYGTKVFKKGKHAGSTYQQVYDKEGVGYFEGMVKPEQGDPEYLQIWKKNMVAWLETQSPSAPKEEVLQEMETANQDLSDFSRQLIELGQRVTTIEDELSKVKVNTGWTE